MSHTPLDAQEPIGAEALFRAHASFVASFLGRMGVPSAEVDDLVQEVFVTAHRKGGYLPGAAQPRTWLAGIALGVAQNGRRSRLRRARASSAGLPHVRSDERDPAEQLETRRALTRVQRALDRLPLEQRAAFVLYEIEGESCESIAEMAQVPLGTVYSRLHNARRRFVQAYAESDEAAHAASQHGPQPQRRELGT